MNKYAAVIALLLMAIARQDRDAHKSLWEYQRFPSEQVSILGYPETMDTFLGSKISVSLANVGDNEANYEAPLETIEVFDALDGRFIKSLKSTVTIKGAKCESATDGCNFPSKWTLDSAALGAGYFYLVFRTRETASFPVFVIVNPPIDTIDADTIPIVFPNFTWQAYNQEGGSSFYNPTRLDGQYSVSLKRPLHDDPKSFHSPETTLAYVRLALSSGFKVFALTSSRWNEITLADHFHSLIITGHDEYWTSHMQLGLAKFLKAGHRVAILGGNVMWWRTNFQDDKLFVWKLPLEQEPEGLPKEFHRTGYFHRKRFNFPLENITGLTSLSGHYPMQHCLTAEEAAKAGIPESDFRLSTGMKVLLPNHPIFKGTGLKAGSWVGVEASVVNYEVDSWPYVSREKDDSPKMMGRAKALMTGFSCKNKENVNQAILASEKRYGSGMALQIGSMGWHLGLWSKDPDVVKITKNVFDWVTYRPIKARALNSKN